MQKALLDIVDAERQVNLKPWKCDKRCALCNWLDSCAADAGSVASEVQEVLHDMIAQHQASASYGLWGLQVFRSTLQGGARAAAEQCLLPLSEQGLCQRHATVVRAYCTSKHIKL